MTYFHLCAKTGLYKNMSQGKFYVNIFLTTRILNYKGYKCQPKIPDQKNNWGFIISFPIVHFSLYFWKTVSDIELKLNTKQHKTL